MKTEHYSERNTVITTHGRRTAATFIAAVGIVGALAACSTAPQGGSGGGTYTLWDPYPDRDASSTWAKAIDACADDLGITIKRNS